MANGHTVKYLYCPRNLRVGDTGWYIFHRLNYKKSLDKWIFRIHYLHIWQFCPSQIISVHKNDVLGGFTFALISYPVDETLSNLTWRLFSIRRVFDLKQAKSEIPRLYAIFQLKLCLSTKMKPLWERFNFCFKNGSKKKTPPKMFNLSKFLGCFVFAPIFKAKVESFSKELSFYKCFDKVKVTVKPNELRKGSH